MLLQILEEGKFTDNFGRETSCKLNNYINRKYRSQCSQGRKKYDYDVEADTKGMVMKEVRSFFKPEFLNRLDDIIVFNTFEEQIKQILKIELNKLKERLLESEIKLKVMPKVVSLLATEALKRKMALVLLKG